MGESKFTGIFEKNPDPKSKTPEPAAAPVGRPATGKRSDPEYGPFQVLIKKKTVKAARRLLEDKDSDLDVSDLVQALLETWVTRNGATGLK